MTNSSVDVAVIGGGAAGLNGALMLARARRSVTVFDASQPRNAPAAHMHGMLGHDGMAPAELLERGRHEVASYGGMVRHDAVQAVRRADAGFTLTLASGEEVDARRVLVATGLVDQLPAIEGLAARWGRDVLHCPYCHGWEVQDQPIGIIGAGPMSMHQVQLFRQWTDDLVWFVHEAPEPSASDLARLASRGITVVHGKVAAVVVEDDRLTGVLMSDGTLHARTAVAIGARMVARADFLDGLGLDLVDHPSGMGRHLPADPMGRTSVPGLWVAGNVADLSAQVGAAAAAGAMAGAQINMELVVEEFDHALMTERVG